MPVKQFSRQATGPDCLFGRIAAGGIGQNGVFIRRNDLQQVGLIGILTKITAPNRDGDDFRPADLASRVSSMSLYLPVPTNKREWYSLPAITSGVSLRVVILLPELIYDGV